MKNKATFLIAVMLLGVASAFAQGGTTGPLTWELNTYTRTLTISGEGEMPDYDQHTNTYAPWYVDRNYITYVVIESGVKNIGNKAFYSCEKMTMVVIPGSVEKIGNKAFHFCSSLTTITIPDRVTSIGNQAFYGCQLLPSINIPASVSSIGDQAFLCCYEMSSIDVDSENKNFASDYGILFNKSKTHLMYCPAGKTGLYIVPDHVTSIDEYAFFRCKKLTTIIIISDRASIGNFAFSYCSDLTTVILPNHIASIGESAFSFCTSLTSINIPYNLARISNSLFFACESLTSMSIPNNVKNIGECAFYGCSHLEDVTIPKSITGFGNWSLACCYKFSTITNLNPVPVLISPCVFADDNLCAFIDHLGSVRLKVPTSAVQAYQIAPVWNSFMVEGGGILVNPVTNNNEAGYTTGDGLYKTDTMATVTATAYPGYQFVNWTKEGVEVSTDNIYSFTVTEDVELVANFESDGTGINPIEFADVKIYPNPTTGELRISPAGGGLRGWNNGELRMENVEIFDVYGRKLSSNHLITSSSDHLINISQLPAGVYFIKITTETGITTRKIIKN